MSEDAIIFSVFGTTLVLILGLLGARYDSNRQDTIILIILILCAAIAIVEITLKDDTVEGIEPYFGDNEKNSSW